MRRALIFTSAAAAAMLIVATGLQAVAATKPHVEDPLGDANFLNDQGTGDGSFGDFAGADAGTVSDIEGVTFRNDAKNLYIELDTEAAPPAATGIGYRIRVNPNDAGTHCILFEAFFPGANNTLTTGQAHVRDVCEGGDPVEMKILGTTFVVPRNASKAFGKGGKLTAPQAQSFLWNGDAYPAGVAGPYADTTKVGTDFTFKK